MYSLFLRLALSNRNYQKKSEDGGGELLYNFGNRLDERRKVSTCNQAFCITGIPRSPELLNGLRFSTNFESLTHLASPKFLLRSSGRDRKHPKN